MWTRSRIFTLNTTVCMYVWDEEVVAVIRYLTPLTSDLAASSAASPVWPWNSWRYQLANLLHCKPWCVVNQISDELNLKWCTVNVERNFILSSFINTLFSRWGTTCSTYSLEGLHCKGIWGLLDRVLFRLASLFLASRNPLYPHCHRFLSTVPPFSIPSNPDVLLTFKFFCFSFHDNADETMYRVIVVFTFYHGPFKISGVDALS